MYFSPVWIQCIAVPVHSIVHTYGIWPSGGRVLADAPAEPHLQLARLAIAFCFPIVSKKVYYYELVLAVVYNAFESTYKKVYFCLL